MTGSLLLCIALAYFVCAYFGYGGYLKRVFKVDPNRPTPAKTEYDGIDFVPTPVLCFLVTILPQLQVLVPSSDLLWLPISDGFRL